MANYIVTPWTNIEVEGDAMPIGYTDAQSGDVGVIMQPALTITPDNSVENIGSSSLWEYCISAINFNISGGTPMLQSTASNGNIVYHFYSGVQGVTLPDEVDIVSFEDTGVGGEPGNTILVKVTLDPTFEMPPSDYVIDIDIDGVCDVCNEQEIGNFKVILTNSLIPDPMRISKSQSWDVGLIFNGGGSLNGLMTGNWTDYGHQQYLQHEAIGLQNPGAIPNCTIVPTNSPVVNGGWSQDGNTWATECVQWSSATGLYQNSVWDGVNPIGGLPIFFEWKITPDSGKTIAASDFYILQHDWKSMNNQGVGPNCNGYSSYDSGEYVDVGGCEDFGAYGFLAYGDHAYGTWYPDGGQVFNEEEAWWDSSGGTNPPSDIGGLWWEDMIIPDTTPGVQAFINKRRYNSVQLWRLSDSGQGLTENAFFSAYGAGDSPNDGQSVTKYHTGMRVGNSVGTSFFGIIQDFWGTDASEDFWNPAMTEQEGLTMSSAGLIHVPGSEDYVIPCGCTFGDVQSYYYPVLPNNPDVSNLVYVVPPVLAEMHGGGPAPTVWEQPPDRLGSTQGFWAWFKDTYTEMTDLSGVNQPITFYEPTGSLNTDSATWGECPDDSDCINFYNWPWGQGGPGDGGGGGASYTGGLPIGTGEEDCYAGGPPGPNPPYIASYADPYWLGNCDCFDWCGDCSVINTFRRCFPNGLANTGVDCGDNDASVAWHSWTFPVHPSPSMRTFNNNNEPAFKMTEGWDEEQQYANNYVEIINTTSPGESDNELLVRYYITGDYSHNINADWLAYNKAIYIQINGTAQSIDGGVPGDQQPSFDFDLIDQHHDHEDTRVVTITSENNTIITSSVIRGGFDDQQDINSMSGSVSNNESTIIATIQVDSGEDKYFQKIPYLTGSKNFKLLLTNKTSNTNYTFDLIYQNTENIVEIDDIKLYLNCKELTTKIPTTSIYKVTYGDDTINYTGETRNICIHGEPGTEFELLLTKATISTLKSDQDGYDELSDNIISTYEESILSPPFYNSTAVASDGRVFKQIKNTIGSTGRYYFKQKFPDTTTETQYKIHIKCSNYSGYILDWDIEGEWGDHYTKTLTQYLNPVLTLKATVGSNYDITHLNGVATGFSGGGDDHISNYTGRPNISGTEWARRAKQNKSFTISYTINGTGSKAFTTNRVPHFSKHHEFDNNNTPTSVNDTPPGFFIKSDWTNTNPQKNNGTEINISNIRSVLSADGVTADGICTISFRVNIEQWGTRSVTMDLDLDKVLTAP